jgi:hypothetical protein
MVNEVQNVVTLLTQAKNRIADRNHWTTGWLARDKHGTEVESDHIDATYWCAFGALFREAKSYNRDSATTAQVALNEAAWKLYSSRLEHVNDGIGHEAVLKVYDQAIEKVRGQCQT